MMLNRMSGLWARTALVWFVAGMSFGMYMGLTQQFQYSSPHAHMGVLGWISSALFAFFYALTSEDSNLPRLAPVHWAAHNLGLATMVAGLYMIQRTGDHGYGPVIAMGGSIVILGTLWLAVTLWPRLGRR
jgi:hypothetical protein